MTPSYLQPLFYTHYIPDYHVAPQLKYPRFPRPQDCAKGTVIEDLVKRDERYERCRGIPDKFAIFAPDHHQFSY